MGLAATIAFQRSSRVFGEKFCTLTAGRRIVIPVSASQYPRPSVCCGSPTRDLSRSSAQMRMVPIGSRLNRVDTSSKATAGASAAVCKPSAEDHYVPLRQFHRQMARADRRPVVQRPRPDPRRPRPGPLPRGQRRRRDRPHRPCPGIDGHGLMSAAGVCVRTRRRGRESRSHAMRNITSGVLRSRNG